VNDSKPKGISRDEAATHVIPGEILCLYVQLPGCDPENKYMVVVGFDRNRPLLLKIDSEKTYSQLNKKFREHQFSVKQAQYPGLEYDSYLDCGRVWWIITVDEVVEQIRAEPGRIKGHILKVHENEIVKLTKISLSVVREHKNIIAASFGMQNQRSA
jgi:hypothetical protein